MPTARELLEQADALMRRNRAGTIDTEVPELPAATPVAVSPPPAPMDLDDVPELTDAVEEIEISSIAELPDAGGVQSEWLHFDRDVLTQTGAAPDSIAAVPPTPPELARDAEPAAPEELVAVDVTVETSEETIAAVPAASETEPEAPPAEIAPLPVRDLSELEAPTGEIVATPAVVLPEAEAPPAEIAAVLAEDRDAHWTPPEESTVARAGEMLAHEVPLAISVVLPPKDVAEREAASADRAEFVSETSPASVPATEGGTGSPETADADAGDDWARWQALAEEIRMQVLQRIDIFTDTALREQLAEHLQPIVDRASSEMVATINQQVGALLRAYIAEAIEREIDKWRKGNS